VLTQAETVATDTPLGADSVGANETESQPDDVTGGLCFDLMVHSSGPSMTGGTAPSDLVLAPGSIGAVDKGVTELGLPCYPGSPSPPISWGQVENSAEQACSWVAAMDRLLREVMAMVG
jgi:hypothetical protein